MGKVSNSIFCSIFSATLVVATTTATFAQNKVLESLERGEIMSVKNGSGILVQAVIQKDAAQVKEMLKADFNNAIPKMFENVASVQPFTTKDKDQLLYLKLRGLSDGLGVLVEVKEGLKEVFTNARELVRSGEFNSRQAARGELEKMGDQGVEDSIELANGNQDVQRMLGSGDVILIEGPLNQIEQMPDLRVTMELSFSPYTVVFPAKGEAGSSAPVVKKHTFLQIKVAFGRQVPKGVGEPGDYRGFGDKRLSIVQRFAEVVAKSVKTRLEKI